MGVWKSNTGFFFLGANKYIKIPKYASWKHRSFWPRQMGSVNLVRPQEWEVTVKDGSHQLLPTALDLGK